MDGHVADRVRAADDLGFVNPGTQGGPDCSVGAFLYPRSVGYGVPCVTVSVYEAFEGPVTS